MAVVMLVAKLDPLLAKAKKFKRKCAKMYGTRSPPFVATPSQSRREVVSSDAANVGDDVFPMILHVTSSGARVCAGRRPG